MELRMLKYFLAVAEEKNISRAAEVLNITQPTLSRQMAQLEEELGARLFERGRTFSLTEEGMMLRRRAEEVVALVEKIEDDFADSSEVSGIISIGSGGLESFRELPHIMAGFRKLHPGVSFQLYTNSAEYVKERIEQGLLDFGLLLEPVDIGRFDYVRMKGREKWGVLINSNSPLARKEYVTREDVIGKTLATSARQPVRSELESWLGVPLSRLDIFATHNLICNTVMLVESGVVSALTLEGACGVVPGGHVVFRPLFPELSMSSVFAWKRTYSLPRAAAKFLEYFKSVQQAQP